MAVAKARVPHVLNGHRTFPSVVPSNQPQAGGPTGLCSRELMRLSGETHAGQRFLVRGQCSLATTRDGAKQKESLSLSLRAFSTFSYCATGHARCSVQDFAQEWRRFCSLNMRVAKSRICTIYLRKVRALTGARPDDFLLFGTWRGRVFAATALRRFFSSRNILADCKETRSRRKIGLR